MQPRAEDLPRKTHFLVWLGALALPLAATGASAVLDTFMSVAGLAMVYLAAVVAAALLLPRRAAVFSALLSVMALNFFFVPPRGSLAVQGPEYWWILSALLGVSLGLGALVRNLRQKRDEAETGRQRTAQLHRLSEELATSSGHEQMAAKAAAFLSEAMGVPCAVFLKFATKDDLAIWGVPPEADFQARPAQWAIDNGKPLGRGCTEWPDLPLWCAPFARHGSGGAVQALLGTRANPSSEELEHWVALSRQIGLAIERERASTIAARAQESARAETARNTLLASLSHDLRTPLASIVGAASALRTQGAAMPASERDKLLANLEDEAQDMAAMADNILQIARLSQPQAEPRMQWESIDDILGAAVARMRRRWPAASIQLKTSPGLPPIKAEAGLLAQAVANLVDNAARHGGSPPRVTVQAGKARDGIFVAVRDHGSGLPEGDPALLFERWRGAAPARSGGSGLGLAICRLAAHAHGGSVTAKRCEPGAEFRIDLPVSAPPEERE